MQPGFFDLDNRLQQLEALGDPLPKLNEVVDSHVRQLRMQASVLIDVSFKGLYYTACFRRCWVGASTWIASNHANCSGLSVVGPRRRLPVARRTSWY